MIGTCENNLSHDTSISSDSLVNTCGPEEFVTVGIQDRTEVLVLLYGQEPNDEYLAREIWWVEGGREEEGREKVGWGEKGRKKGTE